MMKKYRTRILSILLAVCLTVSISAPAFAAESNTDTSSPLSSDAVIDSIIYPVAFGDTEVALLEQFNEMTISELNTYISDLASTNPQSAHLISPSSSTSLSPAFLGWLAASVILLKAGLPCACTLVEHSLAGENYSETNGMFSNKIKNSATYQANPSNPYPVFVADDNLDLHLALNKTTMATVPNSGSAMKMVYDTFNFEWEDINLEESWYNILEDLVNDFGWLMENIGVFHVIYVTIGFSVS